MVRGPQVLHDTRKDGRFRTHPNVMGEPYIRFYAGAPLITSTGHRLGTLCAFERCSAPLACLPTKHLVTKALQNKF